MLGKLVQKLWVVDHLTTYICRAKDILPHLHNIALILAQLLYCRLLLLPHTHRHTPGVYHREDGKHQTHNYQCCVVAQRDTKLRCDYARQPHTYPYLESSTG